MLRQISYRAAGYAFLFTGLWFVIGAFALWVGLPGVIGLGGEFFVAWLVLWFLLLGASGAILTLAALNLAFPGSTSGDVAAREARMRAAAQAAAARRRGTPPPAQPRAVGGARRSAPSRES